MYLFVSTYGGGARSRAVRKVDVTCEQGAALAGRDAEPPDDEGNAMGGHEVRA